MQKYNLRLWAIRNRDYFIGAVLGGIAGYFYWKFVGCSSGTCMISSKPLNSIVYFAVSGMLITSAFRKEEKK